MVFRKSPHRAAALKKTRVELIRYNKDGSKAKKPSVFYKCESCTGLFKPNEIEIDHVIPLGPAPGSKNAPVGLTWTTFISRLFCGPENLQALCKTCHRQKTFRKESHGLPSNETKKHKSPKAS
jgi:5-methylcytosine-specific restriction endonuclease McrA